MTIDEVVTENGSASEKLSMQASKQFAIEQACIDGDLDALVRHANSSGGLLNDSLRLKAWPLLLGYNASKTSDEKIQNWRDLPIHPDEEQVQKDVDRAFVYYPSDESQHSLSHKREALSNLIVKVLRTYSMLHYFQGYHDIVQVFLLVLGEEAGFEAVSRVSLLRIRDYMLESLSPSTRHLLLIPAILRCADQELASHMSGTPPYFALSAVLTLYAHDIQEYTDIARLYDFILAHEPVMTIYLFAALIIGRREELLQFESDDHDMMLFTLSKLPQTLDLEGLIASSLDIFGRYPPERLPGRAWYNISSYSVLKTSRHALREQNMTKAQEYFKVQSWQLIREQRYARMWKQLHARRKPIVSVGITVLVGMLSYYLRKSGHDRALWTLFWQIPSLLSR